MPDEDTSITFKVEGEKRADPRTALIDFLQDTIVDKRAMMETKLQAAAILAKVLA